MDIDDIQLGIWIRISEVVNCYVRIITIDRNIVHVTCGASPATHCGSAGSLTSYTATD